MREQFNTGLLPEAGLVRLKNLVGPGRPIPLSRSAWWAGIKAGLYPQPIKIGRRAVAWPVDVIREFIRSGIVER